MIVLWLLLLVGLSNGQTSLLRRKRETVRVTTINRFVDVFIREAQGVIKDHKLDPFDVPFDITHKATVYRITLANIQVANLSTIHRSRDIEVFDNEDDRILDINIALSFEDLQIVSDFNIKGFLLLPYRGRANAKVKGIEILLKLSIDFKNTKIILNRFDIPENQHVSVKFSNNLTAFLLNLFTPIVTTIFGRLIIKILRKPIEKQIRKIINVANILINYSLDMISGV